MKLTKLKLKEIIKEEVFKQIIKDEFEKEGLFENIKSIKEKDDIINEIAPVVMGLARGAAGVGRAVAKGVGAAVRGASKLGKKISKSKPAKKAYTGAAKTGVALQKIEKAAKDKMKSKSTKKNENINEVDFEKVKLPSQIKRFLGKFVQSMKDANLNRIKRSAILYKVIEASGMNIQQLMSDIQKIKKELK